MKKGECTKKEKKKKKKRLGRILLQDSSLESTLEKQL